MSNTAVGRTVFMLGLEALGNREAYIVESGDQYDVAASTNTAYTNSLTQFPYSAE